MSNETEWNKAREAAKRLANGKLYIDCWSGPNGSQGQFLGHVHAPGSYADALKKAKALHGNDIGTGFGVVHNGWHMST